jgi:hypothetical protein
VELVHVDTRKPLEMRWPTAEVLGESTTSRILRAKPLTLSVPTMIAALPGGSRSRPWYSDRESALALASACVCSHIELRIAGGFPARHA